MKLNIAKIKIKPGTKLDFSLTGRPDPASFGYDDFLLSAPLTVSGSIVNRGGGDFPAVLAYRTGIELACSRCGRPYCAEASGELEAHFVQNLPGDAAGEEERWPLCGDEADIAAPALSEISFNLPMQPLCREDCRGRCPRCGVDLNHHSCSCAGESSDPRWDKLKNLLREK